MSTQKGEDEYATFTGKGAEEAEAFIHTVNRRAWAAGKLNDYAWMANFAYACFTNKALRWYEELGEETQNDWRLLRRAILAKYTTPPQSPSIVPSSDPASASLPSSVQLAPAEAPLAATTVRRGRIRIDHQGDGSNTYVAHKYTGTNESFCTNVRNVSDARVFEIDTISRTITFQDDGSRFIVRANGESCTLEPGRAEGSGIEYGALFRSFPSSKPCWIGTGWDDIWSVGLMARLGSVQSRRRGPSWRIEPNICRLEHQCLHTTSRESALSGCHAIF